MPSTVVRHIDYNEALLTLRVTFVSGLIYDYKNVPEEVYLAMKSAPSKGTYLNQYIKNHYDYIKISECP